MEQWNSVFDNRGSMTLALRTEHPSFPNMGIRPRAGPGEGAFVYVYCLRQKDYEIVSPECGELRILRYNSGRHDSTSMIFGRQITAVEAEVKYKFRLQTARSIAGTPRGAQSQHTDGDPPNGWAARFQTQRLDAPPQRLLPPDIAREDVWDRIWHAAIGDRTRGRLGDLAPIFFAPLYAGHAVSRGIYRDAYPEKFRIPMMHIP
ncbi:hypothetical protein Bbelb_160230 [Branchiostoma belcheri]|nr:hypothetical protein Bbelb_160230 [Branchiostoma belcheri]